MKYLCLVYLDEKMRDALPKAESEAWIRESLAYDEELRRSGHFLAAQALHSVSTASTVKVRGGKLSLSDGPFAETQEQLAGFILIEARDLNEAILAAAKIPGARYGKVEVRPCRDLTGREAWDIPN
ncbi:MAG TPA: YciI family protein [Fibrobacteria bacterium]|nr:YciI family protein [Fibrobacteria bacterium]